MSDGLLVSPTFRNRMEESNNSTNDDRGFELFLSSSGKLFEKSSVTNRDGLIATFRNHHVRNKLWHLSSTCFHPKTGAFAVCDERGQVFNMSIPKNSYNSIRMASVKVSAMSYVASQKHNLVVAYETGVVVVMDINLKCIVGNIQPKSLATIRLIKTHPILPLLVMVDDDMNLTVWDLR
jgi:hypothetical protein